MHLLRLGLHQSNRTVLGLTGTLSTLVAEITEFGCTLRRGWCRKTCFLLETNCCVCSALNLPTNRGSVLTAALSSLAVSVTKSGWNLVRDMKCSRHLGALPLHLYGPYPCARLHNLHRLHSCRLASHLRPYWLLHLPPKDLAHCKS